MMPFAARGSSTALVALGLALALSGCGGSSGDGAAAPSDADAPGPLAATGVTDGRTGPAVTATDSEAERELAPGGRPDPSDPRRRGGRNEGIGAGDLCEEGDLLPLSGNVGRIEATTLCLLNGVRADDGLRPLQTNAALARAALAHSTDMVANSYFAHEGQNGSEVKDRIDATGYLPTNTTWIIGENLAWGTGALATPKAIVNSWMNSKGHRENILKAEYREIGLGIVTGNPEASDGDGATYATTFGARGDLTAPAASPQPKGSPRRSTQRRAAAAKVKRARRARARRASVRRADSRRAAGR